MQSFYLQKTNGSRLKTHYCPSPLLNSIKLNDTKDSKPRKTIHIYLLLNRFVAS